MTFKTDIDKESIDAIERRIIKHNEKSFEFETERVITKEGLDYSIIIKIKNNLEDAIGVKNE